VAVEEDSAAGGATGIGVYSIENCMAILGLYSVNTTGEPNISIIFCWIAYCVTVVDDFLALPEGKYTAK
jgi:hypothetical protein